MGRAIFFAHEHRRRKLLALIERPVEVLLFLPARLRRLGRHLRQGVEGWDSGRWAEDHVFRLLSQFGLWCLELPLLLLDCVGISEGYELLMDWLKWNSRPLDAREEALARALFGDRVNYRRVRLDERAFAGPRQGQFCYVSFYHVNSWGGMDDALLLHELVHVWQYQRLGSRYISQALRAQASSEGYDYGGTEALRRAQAGGKWLGDFNLEQQADIIADYVRLRRGLAPRWGHGVRDDLPLYEFFVRQLRHPVR